jgi:hypothetical protein
MNEETEAFLRRRRKEIEFSLSSLDPVALKGGLLL